MSASANGQRPSPAGKDRRRDFQPRPDSYYGMSVLNAPVWEEREIAGYLFLGGLAGAGSILAAAADLSGRPTLARRSQFCASAAISVSLLALVKDLGRPERFLNMLRVFKPTSPMSVGTWILSTYAPLSFAATGSTLTGIAPTLGRLSGIGAGAMGSLVATYTGALISDTAVPAWHGGYREMPFLFAGSAAAAAGGFGLLAAPRAQNAPAWRMALIGAGTELALERALERRVGSVVAETLENGVAGRRLRRAKALSAGGAVLAGLWGRRSRAAAAAAGAALMAGSAFTRFGIFAAGMTSAEDPRFTVEPQRQRIEQREVTQ